jgi:hypothetical protein
MRPWLRGHWAGTRAGLLLVALAAALCPDPPSASAAGCSGYVHSGSHTSLDGTFDFGLIAPQVPEVGPLKSAESSEPAPGHCTGPNCSRHPDSPAPTPIPVPQRTDQWGVLTALQLTRGGPSSPRWLVEVSPRPISAASAIFHPPRHRA